jgi:sigma-B regulation protein RsbU (phosphoserine phosphatase)
MSETGVAAEAAADRADTDAPAVARQRGGGGRGTDTARAPRRLPSVRLLITLIVVVPITLVSIALVFIATVTGRRIAEQLGQEIVSRATDRSTSDIMAYLGSAVRLSELYVRRIEAGLLPTRGLEAWERTMFHDMAVTPDVASVCFANTDGDCTWLLRAHGRLELGIVSGAARDKAIEWIVSESGHVDRDNPIRIYHYDALGRPWYKAALASAGPVWTPIYFWFQEEKDDSVTGTGFARTVRGADGQLLGVLIIDVTLGAISDHLEQMPIAGAGYAFIVDEQGLLVAASQGAVNSRDGRRLSPAQSDSPAARAIADLVSAPAHGAQVEAPREQTSRVFIDENGRQTTNRPARVQVTEIKPYQGIHWHIVSVLPEASFLSGARSLQTRAIIMASVAVIAGLALGLILSRRVSQPLLSLTEHVARVGAGDFDNRLHLSEASELHRLAEEVNRMAGGLKQRMALEHALAVAEQVQQSLLPQGVPTPRGLEIAACSKYCDSTGGDYFDFIHIATDDREKPKQTLVAVGDVTGHGIGAALLMATARGALRATTLGVESLGETMNRVNLVLASDARHGLFMTLALVLIDPDTRIVRWASAGHDPSFVYHPDSDSFEELFSGDLPLGIETDVNYVEFSRPCATPGTIILIGTDGIWEARNADGEMYGKPRLRQLIREHHRTADDLSNAIKHTMYSWTGETPLQDDVTFVILKVREYRS